MYDLRQWRQLTASWQLLLDVQKAKRPEDRALAGRKEQIEKRIAETQRVIDDARRRHAAALRALRALSKKLGLNATRPLPRLSPSQPRPDVGPYGIRYAATDPGLCVECGAQVGIGPVAWRRQGDPGTGPGPVCEDCLQDARDPLIAFQVLIHFVREAGGLELLRSEDELVMKTMILMVVTLYQNEHFQDMPFKRVDPEMELEPLLARLQAAHPAEEEDAVAH